MNVLVTGTGPGGFFVQDAMAAMPDNTGLFIYYPGPANRTDVLIGDRVTIPNGGVQNFNGQIQISSVATGSVSVVTRGNMLPAPVIVTPDEVRTGGSRATALEGVFVRIENVTVANIAPTPDMSDTAPTNEFTIQQLPATAELLVNDYLSLTTPFPTAGESLGFIQGILELRNGNSKLEPRGSFDMQRTVQLMSLGPAGQFTREGMAAPGPTIPSPLKLRINSAQPIDTVVTLSSDPGLTVAPTVTVLAGQVEADVLVQGVTQTATATISATLDGGAFVMTAVRVVGNAEVPQLLSCSPNPLVLPEEGTAELTLTTDIPVAASTPVTLDGGSFASVGTAVSVAANARTASFTVLASPSAMGNGELEATMGASTLICPITISNAPVTNHVVISEVATAGPGGAADEFVELYNPTMAPVDMSGWRLQYKSATGATYQNKVTMPAGATIPPRGYYLITSGGTAYTGTVTADLQATGDLALQATAAHVRIGTNQVGTSPTDTTVIDTVGYGTGSTNPEGGAIAPSPPGGGGTIERKANANSSQASMATGGADALLGNGLDSDNNGNDWVQRAARDPQNRMSPTEP
ncbi:MAG: lamin tail domain-containing protein [Myxococcaceae bacterium]|nr:lamin tail domain-containing protein [Myxococcaceae bacterium]